MIAAFCCYKRMPYKMHVYKADIKYWPGSEDRNTLPPGRSLHSCHALVFSHVSVRLTLSKGTHSHYTPHTLSQLSQLSISARVGRCPLHLRARDVRPPGNAPVAPRPRDTDTSVCVEPRMMF